MISKFPRKTGWVTTWDKRCGIASYSKNIVCYLSQKPLILAQKGDRQHFNLEYTVIQCWNEGFTSGDKLYELEHVIVQHDLSEVHFQYNFDFFDPHYLYKLFSSLKKKGISIYITMHSTSNEKIINKLIPALQLADIIFVHAELDFYRLYKFINRNKVKFIPHGICNYNVSSRIKKYPNYNNHVHIISTYGFFLPNKGLLEIIQAIKILKLKGENIYLKMVNADYGRNISFPYIESCKKKIRELNLSENVEIISDYLDDEESLNLLCTTELIVFPYQKSGESASGAVRLGLCSGIPVAVSPLKIFDDVKDAVFTLPGIYPQNIADGIEEIFSHIANNSTHYTITAMHALQWRKSNDYANIVSYIDHQMALTSTVIDCLTAHQVKRQIFLDVSNIINYDHHTGIQRVVKGVLNSLLQKPPFGCSILPVYIKPFGKNFFYSAEFADKILNNVSNVSHPDVSICFYPGDIFFGLDWTPNYISHYNSVLSTMRNHGVSVKFRKRSQGSRH
jgi:glycosyltransferase involved in cell wall biosynthesis